MSLGKWLIILIFVIFLSSLFDKESASESGCVSRGIEYYKSIGSYPTLQSDMFKGKSAKSLVEERCARTSSAY